MTVEIRELVIQAKVAAPDSEPAAAPVRTIAQAKATEARWVELVARRVLDMLREEGGWNR
ncbi:DUF5908 family protein [Burkholderia ubonensis]|uniref:DUF5908 family protein n=1 Tax=Burkholderia ubonensis TaxID=101571 RepID=UPI0009B3EDAB